MQDEEIIIEKLNTRIYAFLFDNGYNDVDNEDIDNLIKEILRIVENN